MTESQPTPLVVTFTANPSIDRTIALDAELRRGEVQRAVSITEQAAGKGINVARVVAASGYQVSAVCAGLDEQYSMLAARSAEPLPIQGIQLGAGQHVRGNTTVTEPSGVTTKLNGPGPVLSANQVAEASLLLMDAAEGASWVALSGSLPPGAPVDWYARLVDGLHATGAKIAVDTSDASLDAVLAALPVGSFDLIKPNSDELAQLTGGDAAAFERAAKAGELDEIVDAATALHARGIANVLVTLGGSGAVLITPRAPGMRRRHGSPWPARWARATRRSPGSSSPMWRASRRPRPWPARSRTARRQRPCPARRCLVPKICLRTRSSAPGCDSSANARTRPASSPTPAAAATRPQERKRLLPSGRGQEERAV